MNVKKRMFLNTMYTLDGEDDLYSDAGIEYYDFEAYQYEQFEIGIFVKFV